MITQQPRVGLPKKFGGKIIDVAEVNQQRWLDKSEQWLEIVDQVHLALARGKPVLQKNSLKIAHTKFVLSL